MHSIHINIQLAREYIDIMSCFDSVSGRRIAQTAGVKFPQHSGSSSSSSRTYRLTWHKLNTIASRTWYSNYREKK